MHRRCVSESVLKKKMKNFRVQFQGSLTRLKADRDGLAPDHVFPATLLCGHWLSQNYLVTWLREQMWLEEQKKRLASRQVSTWGERDRHNSGFKRGCHGSSPILSSALLTLSFLTLSRVELLWALNRPWGHLLKNW